MARHTAIRWFTKSAALRTQLQPHQQRVVDKITKQDQPGLVVAHGLGSGKTLAAIAAQDALNMDAGVVLPAALRGNYAKEQKKHVVGPGPETEISSLEQAARAGAPPAHSMLIVDEAHRARTPGTKTNQALKANSAEKRLLLTASPFYNHPADISPLVNIASGAKTLPESRADFSGKYVREQQVRAGFIDRVFRGVKPGVVEHLNPATKSQLGDILGKWVDYHASSREGFPDVKHEDVEVPMTPHQLRVYDSILGEAPPWVAAKIRRGLPPSKQEAKELNAFLNGARQVANSTRAFESGADATPAEPKIDRAFAELKKELDANPRAKAAVYSNWLESGISPYRQRLQDAGIPFGEFTGEMNRSERDRLVQDYNEGKLRTLLLSSAGGEGLDLKGTRLMQILDPHWNEEKLRQVEGRGARYMSHAALPENERAMRVQRFISTRPKKGILEGIGLKKPGYAVDQYLTRLSADKARLNDEFTGLLAERSQQPAVANAPSSTLHKVADVLGLTKEQREARHRTNTFFRGGSERWDDFLTHARRKSFAGVVQKDPRADEKLQRHVDQVNRLLTGKTLDRVRGDTGTYRIVRLRGTEEVGCTCNDWRYRRSVAPVGDQDCKHVKTWKKDNMSDKTQGVKVGEAEADAERKRARSNAMHEVAGLGILAAPALAGLGSHLPGRVGRAFKPISEAISHGPAEHAIEAAGLGVLARPSIQELRTPESATKKLAELLAAPWPVKIASMPKGTKYVGTQEQQAWREKLAEARLPNGDGYSVGRDHDGFYCSTHRTRSKSYPSVSAIPAGEVRRVASTS